MKTIHYLLSALALLFASCNNSGSGDEQEHQVKTYQIDVISFNIRYATANDGANSWQYRRAAAAQMLNTLGPDMFGIQEGRQVSVDYFDEQLTEYTRIVTAGNYVNSSIYYRTEKFDVVSKGLFYLSETPSVSGKGWDATSIHGCNWAQFKHKESGRIIWYFNTHFDVDGKTARIESSKLMVNMIKTLAGDNATVILTADFNTRSNGGYLTALNEYMQLSRTSAASTDDNRTYNGFNNTSGNVIDHIYSRNLTALIYHTITENYGVPYVSDHYPISTKFSFIE